MLLAERLHLGVERADEVEPLAERAHVVDPVEEEVGHRVRAEREHHRRHAVGAPPQLLCRPVEPQLRELHAAGASGRRRRARRRRRRRAGELRGGCDRRQRDDRVVVVAQVENRRSRLCRRATAAVAADAGHRAHDGVRAEQERDGHDAERAARHHSRGAGGRVSRVRRVSSRGVSVAKTRWRAGRRRRVRRARHQPEHNRDAAGRRSLRGGRRLRRARRFSEHQHRLERRLAEARHPAAGSPGGDCGADRGGAARRAAAAGFGDQHARHP